MPFDSGSISFTLCELPREMPQDALKLFAEKRATSLEAVSDEPQVGWVSGRHLLETRLDEETCLAGGYLHLHLRTAVRKVPSSLFKAECRIEELAVMAESQSRFIHRKRRQEIREDVQTRLLKQMPPTISGIPFVVDDKNGFLYLGATSPNQLDNFLIYFYETLRFEPVPLGPESLAGGMFSASVDALPVLSFTTDPAHQPAEATLGRDFLTWLWYFQEEEGGTLAVDPLGEFAMLVDGPLTFAGTDPEESETVIRKGTPTITSEAAAAMKAGKKLRQAKLTFARDEQVWSFVLDADTFGIRSLSLPAGEELDPDAHFQERMEMLDEFRHAFFRFYEVFLERLANAEQRQAQEARLAGWLASMQDPTGRSEDA